MLRSVKKLRACARGEVEWDDGNLTSE